MPIPHQLQASWKFIEDQVIDVHMHWTFHEKLFNVGQKRFDLLNTAASNFFYLAQQNFLLAVLLKLCKLGDPASNGKFENMTLTKLRDEIKAEGGTQTSVPSKAARLDACLDDFGDKSAKIRVLRNKMLAHTDRQTAMQIVPLIGPTRKEIQEALESLSSFMHEVNAYFGEIPTAYGLTLGWYGADDLVAVLKGGFRYRELQQDGTIDYADIQKSQWMDA
jgi:hypothetical protein